MAINNTVNSIEFVTAKNALLSNGSYGPYYYAIDWFE